MKIRLPNLARRFCRDEDGSSVVIEFVIFVPLLFSAFLMATELGIYSMRQMFLDRGLDMAVRNVRLNPTQNITHQQLKDLVCYHAGFIEDCDETLRLEMVIVDMRTFAGFAVGTPDCVDTSLPITPVRGFTLAQAQAFMLVRACVKFNPVFATSGIGKYLEKDGTGRARLSAVSAFVTEP